MQEQNLKKETLQLINLWKIFMWSSLPGGRATTTMFIGATITLFIIIAFVRQVYFNEIISIWNIGVMIILYGIISGKGLEILFKVQRAYSGAYGDIDYSSFAISKDLFYGIGFLILGSWLLYTKLFNELESAPERNRERVQEKEKTNAFLHNEKEKTNAFLLNEKEKLEEIYGSMPRNEKERVGFAKSIDSILNSINLEDPVVFNKFAPFLLYSANHNEKLKGMDLRLVYESKNENLKNDWIEHANKKVGSLRCSFNIDKINDDEIKFCKNFSKLTKVELFCTCPYSFDQSKTWSNSMEVLSILKEIPACTEVELRFFTSGILKNFIDGALSNSDVLQQLNKLKIVFYDDFGIRSLNNAVEKFPSLVTSLKNLSEITIENQADIYYPSNAPKSDKLVNLIKRLPTGRKIAIKLIGRFIESNEGPEFVNALKEEQNFVNALEETPHTVEVSIVYKLYSFSKEDARILRDTMKDSKLNITILDTSNGIERPITTEILDNLLKVKNFRIWLAIKEIMAEHTNMNDFLSSLDPFFQEREWKWVEYTDKNPRTEICELLEFVKALNTSKFIRFKSKFLEISNKKDINDFISEVNKRDKRFILNASELLIDFENLISIYNKMQENENFTVESNSWFIRVRKGNKNVNAFNEKFEEIYKKLYPEGLHQKEFLKKIEALSELDAFTIDLKNKDVLYIGNEKFNHVLKVLPTIKNKFKKVIVAEEAFTVDQIKKLRAELGNGGSCTLEILPKESLLTPWLTSKNYLIRLFLWLKNIFAIIPSTKLAELEDDND
ncbi:hypothetical protein GINT2_000921 [Glugoides intestinalis]